MAALAAKAMGAVPVKEKQALLETRRQQTKKAKSILAGSSSRSVTSEQAGESRSLDGECVTWLDASSKEEGGLKRPDGAMDRSFGRLALQASSTFEGTEGDTYVESSLGTNYDGSSPSKFCIRQYTEIVRQDRGDLKQSWPLAEEYLRGRVLQGRVQVSLWPPIGGGESALTQAYKTQSSTPEGPLPHLFKLEIAFAESGLSEDKPDQSWLTSEEVGIEKRSGAQIIPSLDLLERRPLEEGACITRTKSFKSARRISPTVDCSGNGEAQERPKKDRRQRDTDAKQVEQLAPSQTGSLRSISRADAKDAGCVVERGGKQVQGDNGLIQLKDTGFVHTELGGVGLDTDKSKRFLDVTHPYASQERKTVDRSWKVQCSAENVADINDRVASTGKGKAAAANLGAEVEGWPLSTRSTTHIGDSGSDPKRGEKETGDVVAIEKETTVSKRRNEDDRVVEERSAKSDGASASRPSTKRQSNKSCPVCRSFSSMSQTTMNVHIDSCLVEHRQEEHVSDAEPVESELEPEREPNRSKILKSKAQGAKPKRKKRSIADIVANSSTRTLEESPGKEGARFIGPYSRSADQVHDSKNLNWVSGNKKKRQPRNVPSRNLNEENENKRRRLFRLESTTEESKPGKQEKRRLPEKERELTKLKQLRVERSSGPSTSISKSPKGATPVQNGVEAESRRSGTRKSGVATPMSQSPSTRSGSGKGHAVQSNKESSETDGSEPVVPLRATRTPAPEELRLEMGEVPAQIPNAFAPGKLPTPAQENSATAAAAKPRASKAHAIPVAAGRLASTVPTSDRAPKAPWYPPAAMLRSGTIPPIVVTEASGSTIHEVTSGVPKSPGSSATAGNLIDTARIVTTAEASISSRKSPRSATANSNKVQKATRSVARETLLSTEINDEAKTSMVDPGTKTNSQVEVQSLAECRISKEVEDYSHQVEAAFGGNNKQSLHTRGGSRAASVGSLPQFSSVQAKTDAVADKISATALVGKSEGEQRSLSDKGRKREERRGLVIAEEESATAISSEKDVSKQDQDTDLSARLIQEGCSTGVSGDTLIVNVGAGNSIEPKVPRLRKRGESKVKSQTLAEKAVGKGKRAPVVDSGQDEDTNLKRGYPNADVSEETAVVGNQRKDDKPKQENQKKDKRRQAGVTAVEQAFKFSTVSVQPAFQEMVVRRIEGVMGQEKASEQVVSKVVGQEKVVVLTSSSTIELASAIREQENGKKERSLAEVQANSNTENARPEETVNKTAQLRLGRDSEVSTSSSQTKEVNSLVQDCGRTAPAVVEDVIQGQCSQDWPLVPPRPLGRKKLPIKCAARSVGTANAVALAAKQASGATRQNTRGTKSVKKPGSEIAEKGNHPVEVPAATVPKTPVSRSRAARQLAKSLPSGKKGAPQIEVSTAEGENSRPANGVADPSAEKKTDVVGSTSINSGQQALLSPSSSWVKSPAVGQTSMTIDPEIVPSSPWNRATEPSEIPRTEVMADDRRTCSREESCGAPDRPQSEELHCTETLFSASQTNTEPNAQEKTSRGAISDKLVDTGPRYAEVPNDTECGKNSHDDLDASVVQVAVSQLDSCFSTGKSPDEGRLGGTTPSSDFPGVNDKDSRENSKEQGAPGDSVPAAASLTVGLPSRTVLTPAKVVIATLQGKPDTAGSFQTLEAGLATFTSSMENAVRLAALTTKVASTSASMNTQLSPARQNSSNPAVGMIRSTPSYRLNATAIEGGGSQAVIVRTGTSTATAPPTSFTSLLQSTTLPPQSSAALSLAMQGTRPLQEACADQTELSRAVGTSSRDPMDTSKRTSEGLNWAAEKQGLASGSDASISTHVAAGTAFFRPPPEMAGPSKVSEAGEKEVSRLPGWMIAAISDPKGGEPGASVITESEHTLTVKGLTSSPECGEMSGSVKVRLWGRDVVVPPNEQSTPANPPLQQSPFGHRSETPSETIVTCLTSTPCLEGTPASSQSVLQVTARPAPARSGQGVADGTHQISMPVLNAPNSVGSADVVAVFGKSNNHQAENYLSRLDYNNQRTPYSANSREELRSSRASKGQTPTAQSTIPPEVIIIDDTAESPAKSGDTFSGEGLTMAFLLDCGALRYLPTTQNGRSGSQLMEVDPSKIPQRLVNHNFNILAELRKIGLVPAPKAVLPASYRHSSLSLEVPHSTPPPASRAVSDQLPPWLLAEKKRKEAQIAENLIVLDDDDEPPTGTVILGERRPLHSRASPGGGSNLSGQSITTGQLSPTPIGKSGSDTRGVDHSTAALRTTGMSMGATTVSASGRHSPATSHAGVHFRRGTSSSSLGSAPSVAQKSLSRKNDLIAGELIMTTGEDEVSVTGQESLVREKSRLQTPGGSKDHLVGQISPGPSRRQREEKEKQQQVPDLHHEKKTPKVGGGAQKSGSPTPVVGGTPSKKGSAQGISILAPTWMSGNNGWPKRGAAAQACKQAVERLKAQIMSSPARDGISQVGTGGVLDFESHMIGQAQEKSTNFGGNLTTANSSLQNISSQAAQAGFRYSSLSSRSGGDHENARSSKEAPHNGRGVGQSPTPVAFSSSTSSPFPSATTPVSFTTSTQGPFMSSVAAAERDVCTVSKLTTVPSVETSGIRVNHASHSTAGVQGSEANKGRSSNQGAKSSDPSATNVGDGNLSNLVVSSTPAREPSSSEQSSPTFSHIGRSGSSSPTVRSRGLGGTKTAIEASSSLLARGAMQSEQSSMLTAQGTPFSRLPPSRLSLPVTGTSMSISSTKALLEQVCFTTKAATDTFTREVSNMHEVIEQPIGGMASPQKRIQPSRRKSTTPVNGGEKSTSSPISAGSPPIPATFSATDITSSSNALNRSTPGFPSCGSSSITDQHRQMEGGMISAATLRDRATVLGAGASRITTNDLPLSPLFGRTSQTSSPSPSSSQGRYTPNNTGINSCDGGTWKLTSQTDEDDQDSVTILTERSPGSGIIPGYRLPPHIARAMGGHTQRSRPTTPTTPVTNGGFFGHRGNARLEHPFKQKDSDSSPRSKDSECPAHERYSQTRSTREEKMKDAQRESPKSTSTETAEKASVTVRAGDEQRRVQ